MESDAYHCGRRRWVRFGLPAGWLVMVAMGFTIMNVYATTPGGAGEAPAVWPVETTLHTPAGSIEVVAFAHPDCPCTRATLTNLQHLVASYPGGFRTQIVFFETKRRRDEWEVTRLKKMAAEIPGAVLVLDEDGLEADRFAVQTSGHVLVYGDDHALKFSGGITASRGHEGPSSGLDAIESWVSTEATPSGVQTSAVYGCPLGCSMPKP